jgi:hypothetical protein
MHLLCFLTDTYGRTRRLRGLICAVAALLTTIGIGAASAAAEIATNTPLLSRWEALRRDDLRVASVTYRLSLAAAPRCRGAVVPQLGFVLHGIEQYGTEDRAEAARRFGLGTFVSVMAAIANSPATNAGINAGDQLIAVNGRALLPLVGDLGTATDARVVAVRQMLVAAMTTGAVTIRVTGPAGVRDVRFVAQTGCPSIVELAPAMGANAWADGHAMLIGAGLVKRCDTDDDLALVIAHELAHNLLHHAERLARAVAETGAAPAGA